jgi:hypothetical protein
VGAALGDGLLPKWQLFVASTAVFNTVQNFVTVKLTRRVYAGTPEAARCARLLERGGMALTARSDAAAGAHVRRVDAHVRGGAPLRGVRDPEQGVRAPMRACAHGLMMRRVYELTFLTYAIAFAHFASEIFVFRSARLGAGTAGPIVVSSASARVMSFAAHVVRSVVDDMDVEPVLVLCHSLIDAIHTVLYVDKNTTWYTSRTRASRSA